MKRTMFAPMHDDSDQSGAVASAPESAFQPRAGKR